MASPPFYTQFSVSSILVKADEGAINYDVTASVDGTTTRLLCTIFYIACNTEYNLIEEISCKKELFNLLDNHPRKMCAQRALKSSSKMNVCPRSFENSKKNVCPRSYEILIQEECVPIPGRPGLVDLTSFGTVPSRYTACMVQRNKRPWWRRDWKHWRKQETEIPLGCLAAWKTLQDLHLRETGENKRQKSPLNAKQHKTTMSAWKSPLDLHLRVPA